VSGGLRVDVLGPVTAHVDGREVELGPLRQRAVFTVLALSERPAMDPDAILDGIWGEEPPRSGRMLVQQYVSRLRRILPPGSLDTTAVGYRLSYASCDAVALVDGVRAAAAARRAGALDDAALRYEAVLRLRRGTPLSGIPGPPAAAHRQWLAEVWLDANESWAEVRLQLGAEDGLIAALARLTSEHPFRERLVSLLMSALHRAGRTADALAAYRDLRRRLIDDLGIEPSNALRELHGAILANAPGLSLAPAFAESAYDYPRPREVPADLPDFVGRMRETQTAAALLTAPAGVHVPCVVLSGEGGAGKTAAAIHIAHRCSDHYPGGQLFADLRGTELPRQAGTVLPQFLRSLGFVPAQIPASPAEQARLFRSATSARPVLVMLDDARDAAQIADLIPAAPGCGVIVTSRSALASFPATMRIALTPLGHGDAVALVRSIAGDARVDAEPEATGRVIDACAGSPLALRLVAARLAARPTWTLRTLAERLDDESRRLDAMSDGERSVRSTLLMSYRQLGADAARAFRLLGTIEAAQVTTDAAGAAIGAPRRTAEQVLDTIVNAALLSARVDDCYEYHDLVRLIARELAAEDPDAPTALVRLARHYVATLIRVHDHIRPGWHHDQVPGELPPPSVVVRDFDSATSWLVAELPTASAVAAQLARHDTTLAADLLARVSDHFAEFGMFAAAETAAKALAACAGDSDPGALAVAARVLGQVAGAQGRWREARGHFRAGIAAARRSGRTLRHARLLNTFASYEAEMGRNADAARLFAEAAQMMAGAGYRHGELMSLTGISFAQLRAGEAGDALATAERAAFVLGPDANYVGRAHLLGATGMAQAALGETDAAVRVLDEALNITRQYQLRYAEAHILLALASAHRDQGDARLALHECREAVRVRAEIGDTVERAEALVELGRSYAALGEAGAARACWQRAVEIFAAIEHPATGEVSALLGA
jgi:DNA-binding SARP family transcriptional activator/tetratricopeptide (TPR) repeat protein